MTQGTKTSPAPFAGVDRDNPWPGLASFTEDLQPFFFGREGETDELLRLVRRDVLTVLFGQSGLGKTSLLQAGLFPRLRQEDFVPIYLRLDHDPAASELADQIKTAIAQTIAEGQLDAPTWEPGETLWGYFHRRDAEFWTAFNRPANPVLVLDQFEELFTLGRASDAARQRGQQFLKEFADLVDNRIPAGLRDTDESDPAARYQFGRPACRVVLSLREDFLPDLEELRALIRGITQNRMRITRMSGAAALEVVEKPGSALLEPGVAQRIVRFVAGARVEADGRPIETLEVEPALLSVVCRELNARRVSRGQPAISADLLAGNRREILADFYERGVAGLAPATRRFIEDRLLTRSGYRDNVALENAIDEGLDRGVIDLLVSRRLLRLEDRLGVQRVELTHDLLAEPVRFSRDARRQRQELETAAQREQTIAEELRRAKRRNRATLAVVGAMAVLVVLAVAAMAFALWQRELAAASARDAQENARSATEQATAARAAESLAARNAADAKRQSELAEASARRAEVSVAEGLVLQGDALVLAGRLQDADAAYHDAYGRFAQQHVDPFNAEAGMACLYQAAPPALLTMRGHTDFVASVAMSPDGRNALSASADNTLKLWDLASGKEIRTLQGHNGTVWSVAISPDGRTAISASGNTLKLWDLSSGEEIRTLQGHTLLVTSVAFSPDGRTALSGSFDETLKLWDLSSGEEIRTLQGHTDVVESVAFSPDGRTALSGSRDKTLKLWDLASGKEIRTLKGHTDAVDSVAFSPDDRSALSGSRDNTLKLWDLASGKEIRALLGHTSSVDSVAISPDNRTALSSSEDRTLKLWDLASGKQLRTFEGRTDFFTSVAISRDSRTAVSGSRDKTLKLWDLSGGKEIRTLQGHADAVSSVAFSPDGRTAVSGSRDNTLKLWDLASGKEIRSLEGHTRYVNSVAVSPDGRSAVSGSRDNTLKLWDLASGKEMLTLQGHTEDVTSVAVSPYGRTAVSGSDDHTLKLWDLAGGKEIRTLQGHTQDVTSVAVSPDGRAALSGSFDQTLKLWDLASGKEIRTLQGHTDVVESVAISPDGRTALSGSDDKTLKLWDLASGRETRTFEGHTAYVASVAISPDGRTALSGSRDSTLKLWDLASGKEIRTLQGHTDVVESVAISPDGHTALSGSGDSTIRIWDFGRALRYIEFETTVPAAQAALQKDPNDAGALAVLGNWYAFRGRNDWAIEFLEKARARGAAVDPLTLGRCYWELSGELSPGNTLTPGHCLAAAQREYRDALAAAADEQQRRYLTLCRDAIGREVEAGPATRP